MPLLDRLTPYRGVMAMRATVGMIGGQIGAGLTIEAVLADLLYLERRCSASAAIFLP